MQPIATEYERHVQTAPHSSAALPNSRRRPFEGAHSSQRSTVRPHGTGKGGPEGLTVTLSPPKRAMHVAVFPRAVRIPFIVLVDCGLPLAHCGNARLRLSTSRRMHLLAVPDSPRPGNRQIPRPAHALASERHRSTMPRMRRVSARCCNAPAGTCLNLLAQSKSALQEWAEDVERRAAKQSRTSPADVPAVGPHAHFTVATVAGN